MAEEPLRVSQEEYDREVRQLEAWRAEYERKWAGQYRISGRIRYWTTRVTRLERRFNTLRRRGWVYLKRRQRIEYLRLRDVLIPRAHMKLAQWHAERGRMAGELLKELREIRELERTIARKIVIVVKKIVHVKIIIYSVVSARPPRKYTKRFQAFYNVDAIRNEETGEFDYDAALTQKEIELCMDIFYSLWNWSYLPTEASEPKWIESGEWTEILAYTRIELERKTIEALREIAEEEGLRVPRTATKEELIDALLTVTGEPKGADLKEASIREEEEEVYHKKYVPPSLIYEPTEKEEEKMMQRVRGQ